jgi:hypothetical protein
MTDGAAAQRLGGVNTDHVPLDVPTQPRKHRNRRVCRVGHATITAAQLKRCPPEPDLTAEDFRLLDDNRPRRRADCRDNGLRPCPFVGCRHNLYLDVNPETSAIILTRPDLEPGEMRYSCVLDLVDGIADGLEGQRLQTPDGPAWSFTLEVAAVPLNLTRERVRQIEKAVLNKLRALRTLPRPDGADPDADELDGGEERRVCALANLQLIMNASGARGIVVQTPGKVTGPRIHFQCSSCGRIDTFWFQGLSLLEVRMLSVLGCMRLSECHQAPVTSKLEGLPAKLHRRRQDQEAIIGQRIVEALREAGEAGMSQRQLRKAVQGKVALIGEVAKKLAANKKSPVRRGQLVRGGPERFFCTVPEPVKPDAT